MRRCAALMLLFVLLFFSGCAVDRQDTSSSPRPAVEEPRDERYLALVKPILDKRCVVCHSCYNSPCQLKLSSYEGLDRGGSKEAVYNAKRLWTMEPSRLFVDASSTAEWRDKGFHSVRESSAPAGENNSLLMKILAHKQANPSSGVCGDTAGSPPCNSFRPEEDTLTCASTAAELDGYLEKHPNRGMPYGFPPLKEDEFKAITDWLNGGGGGPTTREHEQRSAIAAIDEKAVERWERFFNMAPADPVLYAKYRMTARYLYEHLFLAHISFRSDGGDFYELVRSKTPSGKEIEILPTVRPYDDPGVERYYYRFRRIYSTIVHKTHMVFELNEATMARFNELFLDSEWAQQPHWMGFDRQTSANPFAVFEQIPARSRYQFLLDNNLYIIMTFIHGPVCKGQVALNVIQDNFWLLFLDPEYDLSVQHPGFLHDRLQLTTIPIEQGSFFSLFRAWKIWWYKQLAYRYVKSRQDYYDGFYGQKGLDQRAIWAGNSDADSPVLTVFRHFNSGSVHRGFLGELPRTLWVMDYPLLERIYYALVAGFDVYGSIGHQLSVRLYTDNLRQEGETYFLDFLPQQSRRLLMQQWYGDTDLAKIHYTPSKLPATKRFATDDHKREFVEELESDRFRQRAGLTFDDNYLRAGEKRPELPKAYRNEAEYIQGFSAVSGTGARFFSFINDYGANLAYVRIRVSPTRDEVVSIVVHRWHDDVLTRREEDEKLDPARDEADFFHGYIGSYPNYFFDVELRHLPDFLDMLQNYDGSNRLMVQKLLKYGVNRADTDFWEHYDWFQQDFLKSDPHHAGLFDLNRYYHLALKPEQPQ